MKFKVCMVVDMVGRVVTTECRREKHEFYISDAGDSKNSKYGFKDYSLRYTDETCLSFNRDVVTCKECLLLMTCKDIIL